MQYMLLIYEDESLYGNAGKVGPALQEIAAKHMVDTSAERQWLTRQRDTLR